MGWSGRLRRWDDCGLAALHDRDDRVRRAEVDTDDLAHAAVVSRGVGVRGCWPLIGADVVLPPSCPSSLWFRRPGRRRPRGPAGGRGRGADSRAGSPRRSRLRAGPVPGPSVMASCSRGSNGRPRVASMELHALRLEQEPQLAIDRGDALDPGVVGDLAGVRSMARSKSSATAGLAEQVLVGEAGVALPLLGRPAPEVREVGAFALQRGQVLVRPLRPRRARP